MTVFVFLQICPVSSMECYSHFNDLPANMVTIRRDPESSIR